MPKIKNCKYCDNIITAKYAQIFCNRSCAASYNNSNRIRTTKSKNKTRKSINRYLALNGSHQSLSINPHTKIYFYNCKDCSKLFCSPDPKSKVGPCCSDECFIRYRKAYSSRGGKLSATLRTKRSIDEIQLFELCNNHYSNVEHNKVIKDGWDSDIIIHDTNTLIFWNGPWHYKEMPGLKHSLKQVQNRDKIKEQLFRDEGWNVIIFEDRHYTPKLAFEHIKSLY